MSNVTMFWILFGYVMCCICLVCEYIKNKPPRYYQPPVDKNYITEVETW